MFMQMLKDEFPDVRLHIISKLELVNKGESKPHYMLSSLRCSPYHSHRYRITLAEFATGYRSAG